MTDLEINLQLSRLQLDAKGAIMAAPAAVAESELRGIAIEALEEIKRYRMVNAELEVKYKDIDLDGVKQIGKLWIRPDILATVSLMSSDSAAVLLAARLFILKMAGLIADYRAATAVPTEPEPTPTKF